LITDDPAGVFVFPDIGVHHPLAERASEVKDEQKKRRSGEGGKQRKKQ